MNTEMLQLSNGYTAEIATDECADTPWEAFDCEPPILTFSDRRLEDYKTGLSIREIYRLLPLSAFADGAGQVLSALDMSPEDINHTLPWGADAAELDAGGWREHIAGCLPEDPTGWGEAGEFLGKCAALCKLAGIACLNEQSNGYCQGDSTRVFIAATPAWLNLTGVRPENAQDALKASLDLFSAWAWGDVYGVASITRPDGEELGEGSCWGFYGRNHAKSGLLEHAESYVGWDIEARAKEAMERERAECADIMTVS